MRKKHAAAPDSFGSFQADVGKLSSTANMVGAWVLLAVALGVAGVGIYIFVSSRLNKKATDAQRTTGTWWLVGGLVGLLVGVLNLLFSRWWRHEVYANKGFAEAAGTMAEFSALSDLLHATSSPSPPSVPSAPFAPSTPFAPFAPSTPFAPFAPSTPFAPFGA